MAGRGTFVSIAIAFALVLLNVSVCRCVTVTFSGKGDVLNDKERESVYGVFQAILDNEERDIHLDREYYAGRLFTKYINLNDKGVVLRMTRWSSECSVSMSSTETSKGRELLEAFKRLLPTIRPYLLGKGSEWVAASDSTDWIDYYVRQPYNGEKEAPLQPVVHPTFYVTHPEGAGRSVTDCAIKPSMLLSHHSALSLNLLLPGDSLLSPDGKYKLFIPQSTGILQPCMLVLEDQNSQVLWQTESSMPQRNCFLAFRTDGTLELWNMDNRIFVTESACSSVTKCAGTASLALSDGDLKLYKSVDDHLSPYWSTKARNS